MKRPILDYYGGKWRLAPKIISYFPEHKTFVDAFCGAGSITLRKPESKNEIINDLSNEITNVFYVLRHQNSELKNLLQKTPYSRKEYYDCRKPSTDRIEQARRTIVKSWFGIGDSIDNETGFRVSLSQGGSTTAPWISYIETLQTFEKRLRSVIIENLDYREIIKRYDREDTLFYFDPPYVLETRNKKHGYQFDWNDEDHVNFLSVLKNVRGKYLVSGYENNIYSGFYFNFPFKVSIDARDQHKKTKEILWANFDLKSEGKQ